MERIATLIARALGVAAVSAALAGSLAAQIIVVPLDPVDPEEVTPFDPNAPADPNAIPPEGEELDPEALFNEGIMPDEGGLFELAPIEPRAPGSIVGDDVMSIEEDVVVAGTGAAIKGLDKLAGTVEDMTLAVGDTAAIGWLQVTLGECRYPVDNPAGDAYAWLVIREEAGSAPIFEGWMIASSPALNALDHARFDVWVTSCTTE
jgi:hypothetical protein